MLFVASKLFWSLAEPSAILLLALLAGAALLFTRFHRAGRAVVTAAAVLAVAVTLTPLSHWLLLPLEQRFPVPDPPPPRVDGIVILGGAVDAWISEARGAPATRRSADRLVMGAILARRYPEARVVFTGGSGRVSGGPAEGDPARRLLLGLGVAEERLVVEDRSRNTWENATNTKALVQPAPGETWLLVTSAAHMPRSVGIFRQVGWRVVPYPVDFETTGDPSPPPPYSLDEGLVLAGIAMKEWYGLVAYRLLGRTNALFPGPGE